MSTKDWEDLCGIIKELGITAVNSGNMIGDDDSESLSQLDQITSLNLGGSKRITDTGLQHLARMPQLRELNLSEYPGGRITDRGLEALQHLRELRVFRCVGRVGLLTRVFRICGFCDQLENVDLLGTAYGRRSDCCVSRQSQSCVASRPGGMSLTMVFNCFTSFQRSRRGREAKLNTD